MVISYGYNSSYKSVVLMKLYVIEDRESMLGSFQYRVREKRWYSDVHGNQCRAPMCFNKIKIWQLEDTKATTGFLVSHELSEWIRIRVPEM